MSSTLKEAIEAKKAKVAEVYSKVEEKGGAMPETRNLDNLTNAVDSIPSHKKEYDVNEINFVDFNGLVCSMTIAEAMELTELPAPNVYENLTFEGWLKTLDEIQDGRCHTVGGTYHTTDDCTHVKIVVHETTTFSLQIRAAGYTIWWGDGTSTQSAWTNSHTYEAGEYEIVTDSRASLFIDEKSRQYVHEIYYSQYISSMDNQFLRYAYNIRKISFPNNGLNWLKSIYTIDLGPFIKSIVIGDSYVGGDYGAYNCLSTPNLEYLVLDGATSAVFKYTKRTDCLKAFSMKNLQNIGSGDYNFSLSSIRYLVLDEGFKNINGNAALLYMNSCKVLDLPSTLESISGTQVILGTMYNLEHMYIRTSIVPTLSAAISVSSFAKIHVKADASYTDADGNTWYGVEAYEHATNWAALTATNTFIADL